MNTMLHVNYIAINKNFQKEVKLSGHVARFQAMLESTSVLWKLYQVESWEFQLPLLCKSEGWIEICFHIKYALSEIPVF